MKPQILITGAVTTGGEERSHVYALLEQISKRYADRVYSPIDTLRFHGTDKERYERALSMIEGSDLIIAEATLPSIGQGMEIQEACRSGKTVIVVVEQDIRVSGLVLGAPCVRRVIHYANTDDLESQLRSFLDALTKE